MNFTGRIEQWFGGSEPAPTKKPVAKPPIKSRPLPPPPVRDEEPPLFRDESLPDWSEATPDNVILFREDSADENRDRTRDN